MELSFMADRTFDQLQYRVAIIDHIIALAERMAVIGRIIALADRMVNLLRRLVAVISRITALADQHQRRNLYLQH